MSIGYKSNNKKHIIELIKWLISKKITAKDINYGTYLPDYVPIEDVFELINNGEDNIVGISVSNKESDKHKMEYSNLFNENGILVSLITEYDLKEGDIPENFYNKTEFKKEIIKQENEQEKKSI